jgi:putative membrane protein
MTYLVAMLVKRPYVIALVLTFVVVAAAERGWRRMAIWLVVGTSLGWLAEFCSTRTGFPFGFYEYFPASFTDELWVSNVPLFASLSFASISYLGWSWTYTLFARLRRGPNGIERLEDPRLGRSTVVALAAAVLVTWSDLVMDPITHLGEYWFLGKIYLYKAGDFGWLAPLYDPLRPTWHFDVPLTNYLGWILTFFTIVWVNQRIAAVDATRGIIDRPAFTLPNRTFWSFGYFVGNLFFMLAVNVYLLRHPAVPAEKHVGWVLVNTTVLTATFVVVNLAILRAKLAATR